ncbi:SlyX family protein [Massilia sp. CCM 8693]|uniref:SlyX family protein n=1 Tax=Massilia aquatica TaxID=2609000 RepID=A0ABX0MIC3_9BURK|nr:SlyX family protein [Massilia aquatica]
MGRCVDVGDWHNGGFAPKDAAVSQEDRFVDIEIKLAHQEDLVESLNQMVYQQGRRIDQLEAMVNKLAEHIRNNAQSGPNMVNDRPPHY